MNPYHLALLALLIAAPAQAQTRKSATAAPAQPVVSQNLPAPEFQSDTRNLEAILGKEEEARLIQQGEAAAAQAAEKPTKASPQPVKTVPAQAAPAAAEPTPEAESGFLESTLTGVRVSAIRWHDAIEIVFIALLMLYVRKLYKLSRDQHKILSHAIRSSEYAAAAAKRSAEICETLMQEHKKSDEAQGKLDLR